MLSRTRSPIGSLFLLLKLLFKMMEVKVHLGNMSDASRRTWIFGLFSRVGSIFLSAGFGANIVPLLLFEQVLAREKDRLSVNSATGGSENCRAPRRFSYFWRAERSSEGGRWKFGLSWFFKSSICSCCCLIMCSMSGAWGLWCLSCGVTGGWS